MTVEVNLSDFELSDLITELEAQDYTVLPSINQQGELPELLFKWCKRSLPDQIELEEWLRNRLST